MTQEILSVFDVLGVDPDDLEWQDFALCAGQPIRLFHEDYEASERTAKNVDEMCLSCPVRKACLSAGIENNEWGVWGGVYLVAGKMDEQKNSHKTPEVWQEIREGIS